MHFTKKLLIRIQEKKLKPALSKKKYTHVNKVKGVKFKAVHFVPGGNIICEFLVHFRGKHHGMSPETIMHTVFHCILHSLRSCINILTPISDKWHLEILLCLMPDDFYASMGNMNLFEEPLYTKKKYMARLHISVAENYSNQEVKGLNSLIQVLEIPMSLPHKMPIKWHANIVFCSFQYQIKNTSSKCKMELEVNPLGSKVIPWLHQPTASLCKAGYVCVFHHQFERCCQVTGTRVPQCCYSYASFPWWSLPAQKQQMPGRI